MFNNDYSRVSSGLFKDIEEPRFDYRGFFRAYVVNNQDPKGQGRVQVRVPSLDGYVNLRGTTYSSNTSLKWAWPGILNCAANDMGSYLIPEVGTVVWVSFEYGTNDYIYFGGIYANKTINSTKYIDGGRRVNGGNPYVIEDNDKPKEIKNQAQKIVYKSLKGATILIDDTDGEESISIIDSLGQRVTMVNNSKEIAPRRGANLSDGEKGYIEITRGDEYIKVEKEKITLKAKEIVYYGDLKKGEENE